MVPEDCSAQPEEGTAAKAILEKPLQQLTEDDITQLTREDCRRYLKEKGMRRPSWNKSQAIQQVIMLKSLLESTPDSDAGSSKRLRISCTVNSNSGKSPAPESVPTVTAEDAENSASAEEMTQISHKDVEKPDSSAAFLPCFSPANEECALHRTTGSSIIPVDHLTIFYGGKVNVYDNIPADKAQAIMNIAATPLQLMEEKQVDSWALRQSLTSKKAKTDSAAVYLPLPRILKMKSNSLELGEGNEEPCQDTPGTEGPSSRKASLQRYLEKKKDRCRFKSKGKVILASCSSVNMYFSHLIRDQMSRRETNSPLPIRQLSNPACFNSVCDTTMNVNRSSGLIHKGV